MPGHRRTEEAARDAERRHLPKPLLFRPKHRTAGHRFIAQQYPLSSRKHTVALCVPHPGPTFIFLFLKSAEIDGQKKMMIAAIMIGNAIGGLKKMSGLPP